MIEKLKKIFEIPKRVPIYSLVAALCGILILILGSWVAMLVTGILLALYSALCIAGVFLLDDTRTGSAASLILSVGVMLLAISLIASPDGSLSSLPQLSGLYLTLEGGVGLIRLSLYRSPTYLRLTGKAQPSRKALATVAVLYTVTLALGAYLLYFDKGDSRIPCAVALILSGAASCVAAILKNGNAPTPEAPKDGYIEADFTDKTDSE